MPQFVHPLLLWGALAATVPVIIHLIHRRRFQRQRWAAMEWLLEAVKQNQRRLQMENLLLLLVRTLAVLLLALAIARPTFSDVPLLLGRTQQTHLYVLLDNSGSTAARAGTRTVLDEELGAVSTLLGELGGEDPVTLVVTNDDPAETRGTGRPRVVLRGQTDHAVVRRRLGELKSAPARADLADALKSLEEAMPATDSLRRRVAIVTDLQESSFPGREDKAGDDPVRRSLMRLREKGADVVLVPCGREPAVTANVAITSLRQADDRDVVQGSLAVFQAEVRNCSDRVQKVEVRFLVDGEQRGDDAVQWVSVPARTEGPDALPAATAQYFTTFRPEDSGVHVVEAKIRSDALTLDDSRAFAFHVRPRIQVLAVDPDLDRARDGQKPETYWLKLSLAPSGDGGPFQVTQMSEDAFHGLQTLAGWDVVLLANVARPAPDDAARLRLEEFVKQGGALFLTVGDHVVAQRWNDELHRRGAAGSALLPARLGDVRYDKDAVVRFDLRGASHPLLRNITDPAFAVVFESPILNGFTTLDGLEGDKDSRVVLSFDDLARSPALVERRFGRGRVLLYTSTIDLLWGKLASANIFPALLHEAVYWLTTRGDAERNLFAFQPWNGTVPEGTSAVEVTRPDASTKPIDPTPGQTNVTFDETDLLGVYRAQIKLRAKDLLGGGPPPARDAFAVNLTPLESDLRRRPPEEIESRYRDLVRIGTGPQEAELAAKARSSEFATPLIAAALACLLLEVLLVQRIGKRRRR